MVEKRRKSSTSNTSYMKMKYGQKLKNYTFPIYKEKSFVYKKDQFPKNAIQWTLYIEPNRTEYWAF